MKHSEFSSHPCFHNAVYLFSSACSIIRNETCSHEIVTSLKAVNRLCLTGTPLHNRIGDLHMLFKFMHCKPFDQDSVWYRNIVQPIKHGDLGNLSQLLRYFMLRRTKGSHLQDLPPIFHKSIIIPMHPKAHQIYQQHYHRFIQQFGVDSKVTFHGGEYFRQLSNLRISCVHPLEFRQHQDQLVKGRINEMEDNLGIMMPDGRELEGTARVAYKEDWVLSTKIQYLVQRILARRNLSKGGVCKKSVIYSQWRCIINWWGFLYTFLEGFGHV